MIAPMAWRDSFRYGPICGLAIGLMAFAILFNEGAFVRGGIAALSGAMLIVAAITSSAKPAERRAMAVGAVALMGAVTILAFADVLSATAVSIAASAFSTATVVAVVGGLARLVRERGVTIQAVAGGLAIYVLVGLVFAFVIDVAARTGANAYYGEKGDGTLSEHVYYSFTVMTTTGFGDFAAATQFGRMLAAAEMLFGQIYLVTVVALLVSNMRRRS
jgi:hypothetical protein